MFGMNDPSKPITLESLMAMLQPQTAATPQPGAQSLMGMFGKPQESAPPVPAADPAQGAAGSVRGMMNGSGPRPNSVMGVFGGHGGAGKGGAIG